MPDQTEAERIFGFDSRQPGRGFQKLGQFGPFRQFARLGGHAAGDLVELLATGQFVFDHGKGLLQFDRYRDRRRQDDDERPPLLAGEDLLGQRLDDLRAAEKLVEVRQDQKRRAVGRGQGIEGAD